MPENEGWSSLAAATNDRNKEQRARLEEAIEEVGRQSNEYKALEMAIGEVLFNVNNYPERAQSRLLGSDFSKLKNKLITAVLAAGFRKVVEK